MTSWANRGVVTYLRLVLHPTTATRARGLRSLTRGKAPASPPRRLRARVRRRALPVAGRPALDRVRPSPTTEPRPGTAVVYLHGGAFVHGIARQHWGLIGDLADATGAPVYVPHYGRAPQHTAEEIRPLVEAVVEQVTRRDGDDRGGGDHAAVRIHLAGDSAGGALALLAAQHLRGDPRVVGVTLISPALDLSQSNPGIAAVEPADPWLSRAGTAPLLEAWAGPRDLQDPGVSPLFGDLAGLPPIQVYSGTRDICWPDVAVLQRRCQEAGTSIAVHVAAGSPHVHVLLPTPEGRRDRATLLAGVTASLRG